MCSNTKDIPLFYELVQVGLACREHLSRTPSSEEWLSLFILAQRQTVVGIVFLALKKLDNQGVKPPLDLLYEWIGISEHIKAQNKLVNRRCIEISRLFVESGFRNCILKGQGNSLMYDEPLYRQSGDIDIWVEGDRRDVKSFVVSHCESTQDGDMHIDFPVFDDVHVEVHYKPRYDVRPKYEKRLQSWISEQADAQFSHKVMLDKEEICVPKAEFNVVMQMSHMMGHFFTEGIGLRQIIDYYYVLHQEAVVGKQLELRVILNFLGLDKFAAGVMWVLHDILGMNRKYLLCEPNEQVGKLVLKEIEEGGNFGQFDQRYGLRKFGTIGRGISDFYRLLTLIPYFPSLALWKMWDKIKGQRWKV